MLNRKDIENNFDYILKKLSQRKISKEDLTQLYELILKSKDILKEIENLKAKQNTLSKEFAQYLSKKLDITDLKNEMTDIKNDINTKTQEHSKFEEQIAQTLNSLPNIHDDDTPIGEDEEDNEEICKVLEPRKFNFEPKTHDELAIDNNWIDFSRGVKIAKSRFSALKLNGAKLNRALINYVIDFNEQYGFDEVRLPFIASSDSMFASGQLPKFKDDAYKIQDEDLYLIPTSEVTVVNMYRDEILNEQDLPIRHTSYSPCFRKEAGSASRDTRGIIRQHQFEKVEIVSICKPDESDNELETMKDLVSKLLQSLKLPHRIVRLCTGDLGFCAAKTYDIEVWLPGQNKYREISSISNTRDFQSRRAKIRYKNVDGKNIPTHTLNGSSIAIGRTLLAIMENNQDENGNIQIPEVLSKYINS